MTTSDGYKSDLINISKVIQSSGILTKNSNFGFNFKEVNFPYPSFKGNLAEIKYYLKASITKKFLNLSAYSEKDITIISLEKEKRKNTNVKITSEVMLNSHLLIISHINNFEYIKGSISVKDIYNKQRNSEINEIICLNVNLKMREILISKLF